MNKYNAWNIIDHEKRFSRDPYYEVDYKKKLKRGDYIELIDQKNIVDIDCTQMNIQL